MTLQGAWDLAVLGRYFALAALVLCLLALVVVLLRKVTPSCPITVFQPCLPPPRTDAETAMSACCEYHLLQFSWQCLNGVMTDHTVYLKSAETHEQCVHLCVTVLM